MATTRSARALGAQAHEDLGPDAQRAQMVGELVGALVQLTVGQRLSAPLHGDGVRRALDLGLDEVVGAGLLLLRPRTVPLHEHLLALGGGEQGQRGQAELGVGDGRLQQHLQVLQQPGHGARVVQVRAVVAHARQALLGLVDGEREIELRRARVALRAPEREARQPQLGSGGVLQDELHLEDGRVGEAALGVEHAHQLLEGHVLVGVGAERHLASAAHQLAEGGISRRGPPA